jgi:hypothetical protein
MLIQFCKKVIQIPFVKIWMKYLSSFNQMKHKIFFEDMLKSLCFDSYIFQMENSNWHEHGSLERFILKYILCFHFLATWSPLYFNFYKESFFNSKYQMKPNLVLELSLVHQFIIFSLLYNRPLKASFYHNILNLSNE